MAHWGELFRTLGDIADGVNTARRMTQLLTADRESAKAEISRFVRSETPAALDRFEDAFLTFTTHLFDPAQRRRAMELYAWLKSRSSDTTRNFAASSARAARSRDGRSNVVIARLTDLEAHMDLKTPADPHAVEAHSEAHRQAFNSMIERIGKAFEKSKEQEKKPPIGGKVHRIYPQIQW